MIVIGITGSIGMGKTTASNMLREMSIPVYDSDATVHFILAPKGRAVKDVGNMFPEVLKTDENGDAYIDREELGHIVFMDRAKKKELEDYIHPIVEAEGLRFKEDMEEKDHKIIGFDIPLLFETGGEERVDVTICVSAAHEIQKERVLSRHGMTSEKFDAIVSGQMTDAEKCKRANYVLKSDEDLEVMRENLKKIVDRIKITSFSKAKEA